MHHFNQKIKHDVVTSSRRSEREVSSVTFRSSRSILPSRLNLCTPPTLPRSIKVSNYLQELCTPPPFVMIVNPSIPPKSVVIIIVTFMSIAFSFFAMPYHPFHFARKKEKEKNNRKSCLPSNNPPSHISFPPPSLIKRG